MVRPTQEDIDILTTSGPFAEKLEEAKKIVKEVLEIEHDAREMVFEIKRSSNRGHKKKLMPYLYGYSYYRKAAVKEFRDKFPVKDRASPFYSCFLVVFGDLCLVCGIQKTAIGETDVKLNIYGSAKLNGNIQT
ncbi:MAG: hypothetical protein U5L75_01770 [Candidatus Campbellbacteria bacterium]|nr:hypothetical protein [Candidatus Campbellbacteria bacterium]